MNENDDVRASTCRPTVRASTLRISSLMPSEKYSFAASPDMLTNGSTAIECESTAGAAADFAVTASVVATTSAASRRGESTSLSKPKYVSASSSTTMIMRSMRRAVCGAIDSPGLTSASRLMPSGVNSNTQENTSIGTNPSASTMTMLRAIQSGAPNIGNTVPATCVSSQAPTRYNPAMRMTFRRLSSAKKLMRLGSRQ